MWHWQQRFDPMDVEGACQRQILKIRKPKPYSLWLKDKTYAFKHHCMLEPNESHDNTNKANEIEASFRKWLRQKCIKKMPKKADEIKSHGSVKFNPWCKPPSLHVNPKSKKGLTRKAKCASLSEENSHPKHSESENQQAYNAWLARTRLEDRVRRRQRREDMIKREQQQHEKHRVTWQKKTAVCAYSTLARL